MQSKNWSSDYTSDEILSMEWAVLDKLNWRFGDFTATDFIDQMLILANVGRDVRGTLHGDQTAVAVRAAAHRMVFNALHGANTL